MYHGTAEIFYGLKSVIMIATHSTNGPMSTFATAIKALLDDTEYFDRS
jgi:hypothetical protein